MMDHRRVSTALDLARVWVHETRRVFADRLISYEDKGWFEDLSKQQGQEHLGLDWDETVGVPGTPRAFLMYADFLIPGAEPKVGVGPVGGLGWWGLAGWTRPGVRNISHQTINNVYLTGRSTEDGGGGVEMIA